MPGRTGFRYRCSSASEGRGESSALATAGQAPPSPSYDEMMTPQVLCRAVGQTQARTPRSARLPKGMCPPPEARTSSAVPALRRAWKRSVVHKPEDFEREKEEEEETKAVQGIHKF